MVEERAQRHLAAILAADVVGYSRLMEQDEVGTLAALKARRKDLIEPLLSRYSGHIFKLTGDGLLAEFGSAVNAVQCAVDLQQAMAEANAGQPEARTIVIRIGVNLGDVIVDGGDRFGDSINIAARLEGNAEPGGILLSGPTYENVKGKVNAGFDDLGTQTFKNISERVHVYRAAGARPIAAPKATAEKPSIAVLPFDNMSGDPAQRYFSDGIAEDIITDLSRFRSLVVIARHSSFQFRDKAVDVRRIGHELGVQYVVEGSVRKSGDRLRITTQLIECVGGTHLWSERYDRSQADLFEVQDDVVQAIVGSIAGQVYGAAFEKVRRKRTEHLGAYDCYLRGLAADQSTGPDADVESGRWYEKALELDPDYAEALAQLSVNAVHQAFYSDSPDRFEHAIELANKAVALDPNNSWSHCALGLATLWGRSLAAAASHIETALRLNPNDADQLMMCSIYYFCAGQFDEQRRLISTAKKLNPLPPSFYRFMEGRNEYYQRHYETAAQLLECVGPNPNYWVYCWLAACYVKLGKISEARNEIAKALKLKETLTIRTMAADWPFAMADDLNHILEPLREAGLPD
jgi:adenylate cyclase